MQWDSRRAKKDKLSSDLRPLVIVASRSWLRPVLQLLLFLCYVLLAPRAAAQPQFFEDFGQGTGSSAWPPRWAALDTDAPAWPVTVVPPFPTQGLAGRVNGTPGTGAVLFVPRNGVAVDWDQTVSVASNDPTIYGGLVARVAGADHYYGCLVGQVPSERLRLYKVTNGAYQELQKAPEPPTEGVNRLGVPNTWYRLRFRVTQILANTTLLQVKMWQGTEPIGWTLEVQDATAVLQNAAGYAGLVGSPGTSQAKHFFFDDYATGSVPTVPVSYAEVTYARTIADNYVLPTPTPLAVAPATPTLSRSNHFLVNVPTARALPLTFTVGNHSAPSNPSVDVWVYNSIGFLLNATNRTVPSDFALQEKTSVISLPSLPAGNYEVFVEPHDPALTYTFHSDADVMVAFSDGANLAEQQDLYFFVPAEAEVAFLSAQFGAGPAAQLFDPQTAPVSLYSVGPGLYGFNTLGKPGVWRARFHTHSQTAHLINLPDLFSFAPDAVLTSKRIRREMSSTTGGATSAVVSPNLKYNNRFAFRLETASSPSFTFGSGSTGTNPSNITVKLVNANGLNVTGSPFSVTPGVQRQITAGQLPAGDYELHVNNPSLANTYAITVPPHVPFVSVDGYGLGNVWLNSYRAFFNVPPGTTSVTFAAKPAGGVPITVYDPSGTSVGEPTPLGNNVYTFATLTPGIWALNLKGDYWSDIRLLNVPQIVAFNAALLQSSTPGDTPCATSANCPGGQSCEDGICACASSTNCSPSCRCGVGGECETYADCQFGLSCVAGSCQDCGLVGCGGSSCDWTSECATELACVDEHCQLPCSTFSDPTDCIETTCLNGIKDGAETDIDCGGNCGACETGLQCNTDLDCGTGQSCGTNNGGCFGGPRRNKVCWPTQCEDGIEPTECGQANSPCGQYCGCAVPWDPAAPTACPPGEVGKPKLGQLFDISAPGVCVDPSCPSNDLATCGDEWSLCGKQCVCTPNCAGATAANPSDGCGGECPHLCADGQECCTSDLHCAAGSACQVQANGKGMCRKDICVFQHVAPPLCGSPDAPCGEQCPACTPACNDRQCGEDSVCGVNCGTCASGFSCSGTGQCLPSSRANALPHVPNGLGGVKELPPLPEAPTSPVGVLAGQFSVSDQGTAQYTVPIAVPPGRAGIEPNLSLQYAASRTNGQAGVGWQLAGLSQITRCPRNFALDGYAGPVNEDVSDHFCIDGKRLETIAGSAPYGTDGAEYRTLIDTFTKVISRQEEGEGYQLPPVASAEKLVRTLQGPDYFEVWMKDGRILIYGKTRDSLIQGRNGKRQAWMLNEVRDHHGNRMVISYSNLLAQMPMLLRFGAPNIAVPRAISYTGFGTDKGNREVRFEYESRNDRQLSFLQGSTPVMTTQRLKRVVTYVHNKPVKNYRLEYGDQDLSQVRKIFECAKDSVETCKPPTEFEYEKTTGFTQDPPGGYVPGDIESAGQLDVNGDGLPDFLITIATVEGIPGNKVMMAVQIGSDVAVQVVSMYLGGVGGIAVSALWNIIKIPFWGIFADEPKINFSSELMLATGNRGSPGRLVANVAGLPCASAPSFFLDYDQDGKSDVVSACTPTELKLGKANANEQFDNLGTIATLPFPPFRSLLPPPVVYDVNGDGLQDIVSCATATKLQVRLRAAPSAGFLPAVELAQAGTSMPYCGAYRPTYQIFDVDGDGTPELLTRYSKPVAGASRPSASEQAWFVLKFTNTDANPNVPDALQWKRIELPDIGTSANGEGMMVVDLNGDGLQDIWRADPAGSEATAWLNTGGNFLAKSLPYPRPALTISNQAFRLKATVLDYNGDGRVDILERWQRDRTSVHPIPRYNVVLGPAADLSYFTSSAINPSALNYFSSVTGNTTPAEFSIVGDLDGDGNQDVFGGPGVLYGKSSHNFLLSKVKDGFGNVIGIQYDAPNTYENACGNISHWPVACLPRVHGLVSWHSEGIEGGSIERSYRYTYTNARVDVTGHGWLGFDKRVAIEGVLDQNRVVTTLFEPVQRYTPSGTVQLAAEPPYVYPLAGLPREIIIDQSYSPASMRREPLEDQSRGLRTVIKNKWAVKQSADDRPFPFRTRSDVFTYSRPTGGLLSPTPFEENGDRRTDFREDIAPDGYGNVARHSREWGYHADGSRTRTIVETVPAPPQRSSWLVSNPELVTITSYRHEYQQFPYEQEQVQTFHYQHDSLGQLWVATRDPNGDAQKTTFGVDAYGNVTNVVETARSGEPARSTIIDYDDDHIFPKKVTNGLGHETQLDFDPRFGGTLSVVDPNGIALQRQYDGLGNLTQLKTPTGVTTYEYAPLPLELVESEIGTVAPRVELALETKGDGGVSAGRSTHQLDNYGRLIKSTSKGLGEQGEVVEVTSEQVFDARGRLHVSTLPHVGGALSRVVHYYDYLDRPTVTEYADGAIREVQYASGVALSAAPEGWLDLCGPYSCAVDVRVDIGVHYPEDEEDPEWEERAQRNVTLIDYSGLVKRTIDGENFRSGSASTNFLYGAFGRLHTIRDNGNAVTAFDYDPYGRLLTHVDPDVGASTNTYNGFGELKTSTDATQHLRTYGYDMLGRLRTITESNGISIWNYDEGSSGLGRLSETISPPTAQNPAGQRVLYSYEAGTPSRHRGLLESTTYVIDGAAYTIGTKYDALGRVASIEYPQAGSGAPIVAKYGYEGASGILSNVTESGSDEDRPIWHLNAAFQGHLPSEMTFGNGAVSALNYDADRRWLEGVTTSLNGATEQDLTYTHYGSGQVHEEVRSSRTREYSYDAVGRLTTLLRIAHTSTSTENFTYDSHGNLKKNGSLTNTYLPSQVHLLDSVGNNQYRYDANGNVDSRSGPDVPDRLQTFTYTPFNLPKTIVSGTSDPTLTEFDYTADESRVVRRDVQAATSRHFASSLYERLVSTTNGETLEERFRIFAGPGAVAEIVRTAGADKTLFFHLDNLGTPQTITDDGGNVLHQEHDAFGDPVGNPVPLNEAPTRLGFTGHQQDSDLLLTDMGGRIYDPLSGRFMSPDPIMQAPYFSQGSNRYSYVFNDPINLTDPSGFMTEGEAEVARTAATFAGSPQVFGSVFMLAKSAGAAVGWSGALGLSFGITGAFSPFGERGGGTYKVQSAQAAPTTTSAASPLNAVAHRFEPGPPVQERPPESYAAGPKNAVPCRNTPDECRRIARDMAFSGPPGGVIIGRGAQAGVSVLGRFFSWLFGRTAARGAVGFADDAVASAYQGMRSGGGHAMRHLMDEGLIANAGSLASRAQTFQKLTSPILTNPTATFNWTVGNTAARGFAGQVSGRPVVVFVAREGAYQGRVISAIVPDAAQIAQWGL